MERAREIITFQWPKFFPHAIGEKKSSQGKNILRYSIVGNRLDLRVRPIFVLFLLLFSQIYVSVISIDFKLLHCLVFFALSFVVYHCIVLILGKFGSPHPTEAQQPQGQRYPFLSVCVVLQCVHTMVWLPVLGICNVHTHVDACDCTGGCTDTVRESATEVASERKIPCRITDSNLRQYCA